MSSYVSKKLNHDVEVLLLCSAFSVISSCLLKLDALKSVRLRRLLMLSRAILRSIIICNSLSQIDSIVYGKKYSSCRTNLACREAAEVSGACCGR